MTLYVIRHGETAWSLTGQHTGLTDIPLTPRGEQDASTLGDALRAVRFSRVFTSPLVRARRTCELSALEPAADIEPDLMEWNYGDYEGRTSQEIRQQRPEWNLFRDGCPQGESPADVSARADRVIAQLRLLPGTIAIFTHGHFGRVLGVRWIGLSVRQAQHFVLTTASVSVLGYEHHATGDTTIVTWNDVGSRFA
jgi:broad specificity phosphatase PhoE